MKEAYLTPENSKRKAMQWLSQLELRPGRRNWFSFDVTSSALLVLDMQRFFLEEDSHAFVPSGKAIVPSIASLVEFFRKNRRPVVFTRHSLRAGEDPGIMGRWWRDVVRERSPESEIIPSLAPLKSDIVMRKTRYSAFVNTGLESELTARRVKSVVISGVTTHLCCDSTARDAFMRDFGVYFVVDGTATWTEELHTSSLRVLADGFVLPVTARELVRRPKGGGR